MPARSTRRSARAQPQPEPVHTDAPADWAQLRALHAVLQHGSLTAAARALHSTQPTLGRHIAALEAHWGLPLFTRTRQGLQPTEAALALAPLAQGMANQSQALGRAVEQWRSPRVQGTVRLASSDIVGLHLLPPLLVDLQAAHPGIRLELSLDNRLQDVLGREVDIAVRMTAPRQPQLIAQRLGELQLGLFAHQRYLQASGVPKSEHELLNHRLIGHDQQPSQQLPPEHARLWQRANFALRCDDERTQWALVCAGAGIGVGQCALAARQPELQRVLPHIDLRLPMYLCMHEDLRHSAAHATLLKALGQGLRAHLKAQ